MKHGLGVVTAAASLLIGSASLAMGLSQPAYADTQLCGPADSTKIQGDHYVVQNNRWNSAGASGDHNVPTNGAPALYPSIFAGCHYMVSTEFGTHRALRDPA